MLAIAVGGGDGVTERTMVGVWVELGNGVPVKVGTGGRGVFVERDKEGRVIGVSGTGVVTGSCRQDTTPHTKQNNNTL